jgi:predicted TIM-barrel fold metal-dependent hydrolase
MTRIIDAHTHVFPEYADLAVRVMDRCGIERSVTLEWHDGFGETLLVHLAVFARYRGRFTVFGNVDFRRINEPGFGRAAADQLERDVAAGSRGLKIYKALGLEYRHPDGTFWRVDDGRLDPIWEKAGEIGIPVLIHTADPPAFWQPLTERNPWSGVLHGEYAWWAYYRKGFPSPEELLGERNEVIARHPGTTFICPHLGSLAENLALASADLDRYPNLFYDLSARLPEIGGPPLHDQARSFLTRHQDRLLFGTDIIYDRTNVPTGMQAQCLYQPGEFPLGDADPSDRYVDTTSAFLDSHLRFLLTDGVQHDPPFRRTRGAYDMAGVGLDEGAARKILWENAARLVPRSAE